MPIRPAKLALIAVAAALVVGGAAVASHISLRPVADAPLQHGLAATNGQSQATDSAPTVALLTQQVSQAANDGTASPNGDSPFALIPETKSPLAPDFTLISLDGSTITLSDAVKKGPVLLDFWAIWCGPCRMEMPQIDEVYGKYRQRGFQVYGINSDASVATMKHFFRNASPSFPMLADSGGLVVTSYGVNSIPALYVIDRNRRVRAASVGFDPNTQSDLPQSLDQLLAEQPQKTL